MGNFLACLWVIWGVSGQNWIKGASSWTSCFSPWMVLGARTLLPILLTISLQTCSRQHLNYFKPPHPFLTHISYPASNLWQGCENRSVRTTAALFLDSDKQPSTWNTLKMAIFIFFMYFFFKFRSDYIDCIFPPCSDRLEIGPKKALGRMWEYCLMSTCQWVHLPMVLLTKRL